MFGRALIALMLAGCSSIDYTRRVEGWPVLAAKIDYVSEDEMQTRCGKYSMWLEQALACAEFYLDKGVCQVWLTESTRWAKEHELAHCDGYDHVGGESMRTMLQQWKETK